MAAGPLAPLISSAGLPHRTGAVLARERHQFGGVVGELFDLGKGGLDLGAPEVTPGNIVSGLGSSDVGVQTAAAWLAGRVTPADREGVPDELAGALPDFVASFTPDDIGPNGPPYVEGLMSMVLTGQRSPAESSLVDVVEHDDWVNNYRFLAAYYLAQMGDPRGWQVLLADLADDEPHTRLMAVRHLLAFRPFDGVELDGETIDVGQQLRRALRDNDPYVAGEVPVLLLEAEIPDVEADLREATTRPFPKEVRQAAAHALEHLPTA